MKKDILKARIEELIREIDDLRDEIRVVKANSVKIEDVKHRDYIIRTNYYGSIKDKNIKKDFIDDIQNVLGDDIKALQDHILNYKFVIQEKDDDAPIVRYIPVLLKYYTKLKEYEFKQIILDTYGEKK